MLSARVQEILVALTGLILVLVLTRAFFLNRILNGVAHALLKRGRVKWAMRVKTWGDSSFRRKMKCH